MAIAREELVEGGRAFMRTRRSTPGGVATAYTMKPVTIKTVERATVLVEDDAGRIFRLPFCELEPDQDFLSERERERAEKKERIRAELRAVDPPALTYTLAEKLGAEPEAPAATSEQREEALRMIEELKSEPPPPPKKPATVDDRERLLDEAEAAIASGMTVLDACAALGIHETTLHGWRRLRKAGRPLPSQAANAGRKKGAATVPVEKKLAILDELAEGALSVAQLSDKHLLGNGLIYLWRKKRDEYERQYLKKFGKPWGAEAPAKEEMPDTKQSRISGAARDQLRENVLRAVHEEGLALTAAAKRFGVALSTASLWVKNAPKKETMPRKKSEAIVAHSTPTPAPVVTSSALAQENGELRAEVARLKKKIKQLMLLAFDED